MVAIYVSGGVIGEPYGDDRYFRHAGLLLLVGAVYALYHFPGRTIRALALSIAVMSSLYGVGSFFLHAWANLHHPLGDRGFRHQIATEPVLSFIKTTVDADASRPSIVLVTSPEIGLEVQRARVLANFADFQSIEGLRKQIYKGRVQQIYVVLQNKLIPETKADIILRSFVDYPIEQWKSVPARGFYGVRAVIQVMISGKAPGSRV